MLFRSPQNPKTPRCEFYLIKMMKMSDMQPTLKAVDGGMGLSKEDIMDPMSDGTTIIALKYNGGILLGADGRSATVSSQKN